MEVDIKNENGKESLSFRSRQGHAYLTADDGGHYGHFVKVFIDKVDVEFGSDGRRVNITFRRQDDGVSTVFTMLASGDDLVRKFIAAVQAEEFHLHADAMAAN